VRTRVIIGRLLIDRFSHTSILVNIVA